MAKRFDKTLVDYLMIAISPALIMTMVGSLVLFLLAVFYFGEFFTRIGFVFSLFVFAAVLVARISIEESRERSLLFALPLAAATALAVLRFFDTGAVLTFFILAVVWWCTDRLTWDCTVIDEQQDSSGEGLLQRIGLDGQGPSPSDARPSEPAPALAASSASPESEGPIRRWWRRNRARRGAAKNPGLWVVYFSLAALPLFGLLNWLIPDDASRTFAFWMLVIYVASGLLLLLTTSFLGLRRYLRQRNVPMPARIAGVWLASGAALVATVLLVAMIVPRPKSGFIDDLSYLIESPDLDPNSWALGNDGTQEDPQGRSGSTKKGESQSGAAQQGDSRPENSRSGQGPAPSGKSESNSTQSGQSQSGQSQSGQSQSGQSQSGQSQSGQFQSGQSQSGQSQSGQSQSGQSQAPGDSKQSSQSSMEKRGPNQSGNDSASKSENQGNSARPNSNAKARDSTGSDARQSGETKSGASKSGEGKSEEAKRGEAPDSKSGENKPASEKKSNAKPNSRSSRSWFSSKSQDDAKSGEKSETTDKNRNRSRTPRQRSASRGGRAGGGSRTWSPTASLGQLPATVTVLFRLAFYAALLAFAIYGLWRYGRELLHALQNLLAELAHFWRSLRGLPPVTVEAPAPAPAAPPRPFSDFPNPFASGTANEASAESLVRFSFQALEAWAHEQGCGRSVEQTPYEFASQVASRRPELGRGATELADLYNRTAYARGALPASAREVLRRFWHEITSPMGQASHVG